MAESRQMESMRKANLTRAQDEKGGAHAPGQDAFDFWEAVTSGAVLGGAQSGYREPAPLPRPPARPAPKLTAPPPLARPAMPPPRDIAAVGPPPRAPEMPDHPVFRKGRDDYEGLAPTFSRKTERVIARLRDRGWRPRVVDGHRTPEEQRENIRKGVSGKGTYAGGPHPSPHLSGHGADLIDERYGYNGPKAARFFEDLGEIAEEEGLEWGGRWKKPVDSTHIAMRKQGPGF